MICESSLVMFSVRKKYQLSCYDLLLPEYLWSDGACMSDSGLTSVAAMLSSGLGQVV